MVRLLLDAGAPVDPVPRAFLPPLEQAADGHHLAILKMLLDAGANPNQPDKRGQPFLPLLGFSDPRVVQLLLEAGASVNARDNKGVTALMRASYFGEEHSIRVLLDHRADVNLTDNLGRTALMHAAGGRYVDAIPLLLAHGADLLVKDDQGQTALDIARELKNEVAVELLSAALNGVR